MAAHPAIRVLLVEDSEEDAALVEAYLASHPPGIAIFRVETDADLESALATDRWDIVVSDYNLPGFGGLEALRRVRRHALDLPFILVSATVGEDVAVEAMRLGADDYVMKGNLVRLLPAILREVGEAAARHEQRHRIERLSRVKAVTSAINTLLVRVRDPAELFREACRIAVEDGGFLIALAARTASAGGSVEVVAAQALAPDCVEPMTAAVRGAVARGSDCEATRALEGKVACASNHLEREPASLLRDLALQCGARAAASIPVVVDARVAALLVFYSADADVFDDEEMRLLGEMTGDIAFALDALDNQERLDFLAYYDSLTGLANRRLLVDRLTQALELATREATQVAIFMLDIDRFHNINDTLGRQAGDAALRETAVRIGAVLGGRGSAARMGGDHFVVMVPGIRQESEIRDMLRDLSGCLAAPFEIGTIPIRLSATLGIALYPGDGDRAEDLLRNAEAAAARAQAAGERHLFYAQEMSARLAGKLELENQLMRALENEEFTLHYQPKVDAHGRRIVALEALLRWRRADGSWTAPSEFIPILEQTGMIVEVGTWVLARAIRDQAHLAARMRDAPRIAVNVSPRQLRRADFTAVVKACLGNAPARIDLEIVESLAVDDVRAVNGKLAELRDLGVHVAIDDFGTGYSSLSYLARLPVHTLKIDRSFVAAMLGDVHSGTLVAAIISLAHALGLEVVAEGVETEAQARALLAMGCGQLQGYLTGRPAPLAEIEARLRAERLEPQPG